MKAFAILAVILLAVGMFYPLWSPFNRGVRVGLPQQQFDVLIPVGGFAISGLPRAIPHTSERLFFFVPLRDLNKEFDP